MISIWKCYSCALAFKSNELNRKVVVNCPRCGSSDTLWHRNERMYINYTVEKPIELKINTSKTLQYLTTRELIKNDRP